jgi:thioredoxin 1
MLELNKNNFDSEIKSGKTVIDFWAPWCGPCKAVAPIFEELSKEMKDVKFVKVNVDEAQEIAAQYHVQSIPTFVVFKEGKQVGTLMGNTSKDQLKKGIEDSLK